MTEPIEYEVSSGNVFADLGIPQPEEALLKAKLALRVTELLESRGLSQQEAAHTLGVRQPHVSRLMRGELRGFSVERILKFLLALDQDVELVIRPKSRSADRAELKVHSFKRGRTRHSPA